MCIVCTHTVRMYSVCVCVVVPEGNVTLLVTPVSVPGRSSSPLAVSAWCRTNFGFPDNWYLQQLPESVLFRVLPLVLLISRSTKQ